MSLAKNGRCLISIIYPMPRILTQVFEWQMYKGVISLPVKGFFLSIFPKFLERGCESLTPNGKFFDLITYYNDVLKNIFDSTSLSERDQNCFHQQKMIAYY